MGIMEYLKNKSELNESKGDSIVGAIREKYGKVNEQAKRNKPVLKNKAKTFVIMSVTALTIFLLTSCGSKDCLYCEEHNKIQDTFEDVSTGPNYKGPDTFVDGGWVVGGNSSNKDVVIPDQKEPAKKDESSTSDKETTVGGNGVVNNGDENQTINFKFEGDFYIVYQNKVEIASGSIYNPSSSGLTPDQFKMLEDLIKSLKQNKDETSDETQEEENVIPGVMPGGDVSVGDSNEDSKQDAPTQDSELGSNSGSQDSDVRYLIDEYVSDYLEKTVTVQNFKSENIMKQYDGIFRYNKAIKVICDLSNGERVNVFFTEEFAHALANADKGDDENFEFSRNEFEVVDTIIKAEMANTLS